MIPPDATFDGTFPFPPRFDISPGFRMHYADEGPRDGEVVLCLHGEPTWGYMFRHLITALSPAYRVVVPDHMGFGKSETPAGRSYWLQDHVDNLERFVLSLDLTGITLVMHDFGGPVGMGFAARHPDRIRRIISTTGPTPLGQPDMLAPLVANAATAPWFQWILAAEANGTLEQVLGQLGYNILSTLKLNGFEDNSLITDTWIEAYAAPFPTQAACAGAIGWAKGFATGAHIFEQPDEAAKKTLGAKPALALWGDADRTLQARHFLPLFTEAFPGGRVELLEGVGHYCLEDAPERIHAAIGAFLQET